MVIRLATKDDIEEMDRIENESFGSIAFSRRQFQYYVKNGMCHVVSANDVPMGYIVIFVRRNSSEAYIRVVAVDPAFRDRGFGSMLLHSMEQLYLAKGYTRMALNVDTNNTRAISLYQLREYKIVGEIPDYYGVGTGIKMIKNLR